MAKFSLLLILSAYLALASAISSSKNANAFITVGNIIAAPNPYPFTCSIQLVWFEREFHICGSSLITASWLLTTPQCFFFPLRPSYFSAHCGVLDLTQNVEGRQRRAFDHIAVHPGFQIGARPENFAFNVAVARVSTPFLISPTVSIIGFASEGWTQPVSTLITMGWGVFQNNPVQQSDQLRAVTLMVTDVNFCNNVEALEVLPIFNSTICASAMPLGPSTCIGDYGGPLVQNIGPNQYMQIGIAYGSQRPCGIGSSAFIDVRPFSNWIWTVLLGVN